MKNLSNSNLSFFNFSSIKLPGLAWRFILSFCLSLLGISGAFAQIVIDGNPGDWYDFQTRYGTNALLKDSVNSAGNVDNQFTGGSKDGSRINQLRWSNGTANSKGDIANAGAALDGCTMYFFADRGAVNGDAAIGFWFYRNEVSTNANGTFSGTHTDGDVLVVSHFTNGGGKSDIFIYTAQNGLTFVGTYQTAMVNTALYPSSGNSWDLPWNYQPKFGAKNTYPVGSFFEGSINLCDIFGTAPCFASFLAETRNSQSVTAALQDFTLGNFTTDVAAPSVSIDTEPSICGPATGCVKINNPQPGTYTLHQPNVANSTQVIVFPGTNPVLTEVKFCDLVAGGGFSVFYATESGCVSDATVCPSNDARKAAPSKASNATGAAQFKQSAEKDLVAYPVPFSDKVNVKFTATRAEKYTINLYDMKGKLVKELKSGIAKAGEVIQMEVSSKGLLENDYLVRKVSKSGVSTVRIMKEK
jgi:hypothetical protein